MNVEFRFQLDSTVDLQEVVDRCPTHMTGADLYALCSDAMTAAIKRKIALIDDGENTETQASIGRLTLRQTGDHVLGLRLCVWLFLITLEILLDQTSKCLYCDTFSKFLKPRKLI